MQSVASIFSLSDILRGSSLFLICTGPSLKNIDLQKLNQRGILTLAINNVAAEIIRPNFWICGDTPQHFCDIIWTDPGIWKIVPEDRLDQRYMERKGKDDFKIGKTIRECPSVFTWQANDFFNHFDFLKENTVTWGSHKQSVGTDGFQGIRSTMLAALKVAYVLGARTVYILGADFHMEEGKAYSFNQTKDRRAAATNNNAYRVLEERFKLLKPIFDEAGYKVFNCSEPSNLNAFPRKSFDEAIEEALTIVPAYVNTAGMYNRKHEVVASKPTKPTPGVRYARYNTKGKKRDRVRKF